MENSTPIVLVQMDLSKIKQTIQIHVQPVYLVI
jgi:hypothetical protein